MRSMPGSARLLFLLAAISLIAIVAVAPAAARQDPAAAPPDEEAAVETPRPPEDEDAAAPHRVVAAWTGPERPRDGSPLEEIGLADDLAVEVTGLEKWIGADKRGCWDVQLYVDGKLFEKLRPTDCRFAAAARGEQPATPDTIVFNLNRIDRAEEPLWRELLDRREGFHTFVGISVGLREKEALPSEVADVRLILLNQTRAWLALIFLVVTLVLFLWLAKKSEMIRDSGPKPKAPQRRPYSLARVQTAWWTFLVLWAFVFIALLLGTLPTIPPTLLGLMGIAAGTFLGAELIDSNSERRPPAPRASQDFLKDVLSEQSGVAFHRFQMFVWTFILGVMFVIKVWGTLSMPEFDATLLGLMGISNGTYLGMKFPEGPKAAGGGPEGGGSPEG